MEVVDELMTPGCPQCAIKHLSAALYHRAVKAPGSPVAQTYRVLTAVAKINLYEVLNGYKSHLWYAVGALERAEEIALSSCERTDAIREARLVLEERGEAGVETALAILASRATVFPADWEGAHIMEADRELPGFGFDQLDLIGSIERIREEFFISDTTAPAAATAEGGGESEMATKKAAKKAPAFLKKEDPKAKQAACKGGKCKGKKCK